MIDFVLHVCILVVSLSEVWLCYEFLYCTVLEKEYLTRGEKCITFGNVLVVGILLATNKNLVFFSHNMYIFCIIITSVCAVLIKRKRNILIIEIVVFYYSFLALLDLFFAFISMIFLQNKFDQLVYHYTISLWQFLILVISRIIFYIIIQYLKKLNLVSEINKINNKYDLFCISVICCCVLLREYQFGIYDMTKGVIKMEGGAIGFSLLVLLVLIVVLNLVLIKNLIISNENKLLVLQENMELQKNKEMSIVLENNKQLVHDIKNHYIILKRLACVKDVDRIEQYLSEIGQEIVVNDMRRWTGNKIVDLVLNQKKMSAEEKCVKFHIQAVPTMDISMYDSEISILFGNLLDNAIEACEKIESEERWIEVKIEKQKGLLFVEISNSISKLPIIKNGRLLTSKRNNELHGYGLKSVERIINRHDGVIHYEIRDHSFHVSMTFFDIVKVS